jgi:hypothetical protein
MNTGAVLTDRHWKMLRESAISRDVVEERGYRTIVVKARLADKGFSPAQRRVPGLLIPLFNARGDCAGYQFRADEPRLRDGKPVKYETPTKSRLVIDVHPKLSRPRRAETPTVETIELPSLIQDTSVPLLITEGSRKADAAVSVGICAVALMGVSAWHRNPGWNDIPIKGRNIYIAFDSDVLRKRAVWLELRNLKDWLESHSADVCIIYLPPGTSGEKVGLDDWIADQDHSSEQEIRTRLLALASTELGAPPAAKVNVEDLSGAITAIMLDKEIKDFLKRRQVAGLVRHSLENDGFFCRTADDRLFYFSKPERRLYDLDSLAFEYLTSSLTELGKTESVYAFTLHHLKTTAARTKPLDIHTLAYFDPATGFMAVSNAGAGVWIRERDGGWTYQHNGDNGLLFLTEPDAEVFDPDFSAGQGNLSWFLNQFLLARHNPLTADDQKTLLLVNLIHGFFPALRRTRPIPGFLGSQGSGKTSGAKLLGRLIAGRRFEVSGLRKEKEDGFIAAICNRVIVGFDNADSRIPWLEDALAVYATGQRYRLRRLYTTNDEVAYDPRALILITSRDPHFNRSDVAERLLPFYFERPQAYRPEPTIFDELDRRRNAIWGELFAHLAAIADSIGKRQTPPLAFRMADFAAFGWNLFALQGRERDWIELLAKLERAQAGFAAQNDGIVEAMRILLQRDGMIGPVTTGTLFKRCFEIAEAERLAFPETAQGFGRRLTAAKRTIELELRCRFTEETAHKGQRWITLTPRTGDDGVGGDDDPEASTESEADPHE